MRFGYLFIYICNSGNAVYFNTLLQEKIIMNIMKNFYNLYKDFIDKEVIDLLESNELQKDVISTEILEKTIELFYNNILKIITLRNEFREKEFFKIGNHIEIDKEYDILDSIKYDEHLSIPNYDHLKLNDIKILSEYAFYLYKLILSYNAELTIRRRDDYEKIGNSKFKALFEGKITIDEAKKEIIDKNNVINKIKRSFFLLGFKIKKIFFYFYSF